MPATSFGVDSTDNERLKIIQISTMDIGGGAEKVAYELFNSYRKMDYNSKLMVGYKYSNDPDVIQIPNDVYRNSIVRYWLSKNNVLRPLYGKVPGAQLFNNFLCCIAEPNRFIRKSLGYEDNNFPGSNKILNLENKLPDIIHCHNLHGNYFNLQMLPSISNQVPTIITLHDAWMLSGHCAYSFDCNKWKAGCGNCPDLTIYPSIKRDKTNYNWKMKRDIYSKSHFYIATPSKWLMEKVYQSILVDSIVESKVIPNGVNTNIFYPVDKLKVKKELGLPIDKKILLFAANGIKFNIWKDYKTLRDAIYNVTKSNDSILFLALGETAPSEMVGTTEIRFIPYQKDPVCVSKYYQAADVYIHASKVESFSNSILEARACGTPVVATSVGGISEHVIDGNTGFLTRPGDPDNMASKISELLDNEDLRIKMGDNSYKIVTEQYSLDLQVSRYLNWYNYILSKY